MQYSEAGEGVSLEAGEKGELRRMIQSPGEIILCPGVYDGLSARIALSVGFNVLYMVRS
jgi:2-methylisocitrate lyase-like PEP mutase family enzyme